MTQTSAVIDHKPQRATAVLSTLILVAILANVPLAVANVALPDIAKHFDASQAQLNLVAVCYSLGLAVSVLWLGALGDHLGRKQMLVCGILLSLPACLAAAWAPSIQVLVVARLVGGVAAGMAYPTTLSLIAALWSGAPRTRSIALWSATGGAVTALGPLLAGMLLEHFWWGSVFLITLPLIAVGLVAAVRVLPAHVAESPDPVDNLGGVLSVVMVGAIVLAINFAVVPSRRTMAVGLLVIGVVAVIAFGLRQRRAPNPLFDLHVAARPIFWVAACAGIIVFGSLMGAMFVGQQFLQNVLSWSPVEAGSAILPAAAVMVLVAPRSARLVEAKGARFTLLVGNTFTLAGFVVMLLLWRDSSGVVEVLAAYVLIGAGVGFAGTPASRSLTGAVPVRRAGMASGTADLQRDLGGAIMQSILGALLTAGYAAAVNQLIAQSPQSDAITADVQAQLTKSFAGAAATAEQYPQYSTQIIEGARESFVQGQDWAFAAGALAVGLGIALVWFCFPRAAQERTLLASYAAEDGGAEAETGDGTGTGAQEEPLR